MSRDCVRLRLAVFGRVQGVLFRKSAKVRARELSVAGWARNLIDGSVEIVCEGAEESIDRFLAWVKEGPPLARVDRVEVVREQCEGSTTFEVREFGF